MPKDKPNEPALLAELAFVQDCLRHAQREREVFLGFTITVTVAIFGLMLGGTPLDAGPNSVLATLLALIVLGAQASTIRSIWGAMSAAAYIQVFLKSKIGLKYQSRLAKYEDRTKTKRRLNYALGFPAFYLVLLAAPIFLLLVVENGGTLPGCIVVGILTAINIVLLAGLVFRDHDKLLGRRPADRWEKIKREEFEQAHERQPRQED